MTKNLETPETSTLRGFIFGVQHGVTSALLVVHLERFGRHHEGIVATSAEDVKLKKLKALMKSRGPAAQTIPNPLSSKLPLSHAFTTCVETCWKT